MKLFSKLLCGAAIAASTVAAGTAEMFMTTDDKAILRLVRTDNGDGTFTNQMVSPNPDLLEVETQNCFASAFGGGCNGTALLKKNGPVDMSGVPFSTEAPYQKAEITSPTLDIDLTPGSIFENTAIQVHEGLTEPSADPDATPVFKPFPSANIETIVIGVEDDFVRLSYTTSSDVNLPGVTTQYQDHYFVGAATRDLSTLGVWLNGNTLGGTTDYIQAEGNKGQSSVTFFAGDIAAFLTDFWNQSGGHYSALSFFTNGTDRFAPGLDLSEYTTLNFEMGCKKGVTVEAFFGRDSDTSQNFLTDIVCDDFTKTYSFDISGYNRSDIQTALWFHIPTWKNASFNDFRIWMNTFEVTVEK